MNGRNRRPRQFRPDSEPLELRTVLSGGLVAPDVEFLHLGLFGALGAQLSRPNTPVAPYGATTTASFVDPSASIKNGNNVVVGTKDYIAPWATLDARRGVIEIGNSSTVQDNATLVARGMGQAGIIIGDNVFIAPNATIVGTVAIGSRGGANTEIGYGATVDQAVIDAGAEVGPLAFVGPGVEIPAGYAVNPGAVVTTEVEATTPSLGFVAKLSGTDTILANALADAAALAVSYTTLYQGTSATGASSLSTSSSVFNGNLSTVEGASSSPGFSFTTTTTFATIPVAPGASGTTTVSGITGVTSTTATTAGTTTTTLAATSSTSVSATLPKFTHLNGNAVGASLPYFAARAIGSVTFTAGPIPITAGLGYHNSIRFDEDQSGTIGIPAKLGKDVTIHPLRGGKVTIGDGLRTGDNVVLTADANGNLTIGYLVNIGANSVINGSTINTGATIGAGSYIADSTVPIGATLPAGTILINNVRIR